jgi:hypothetical protein
MRYFHVIPSKFVCANSNFQNEFPFCVPVSLMKWQGVANIFHARYFILKMSVYSLVIARECGGNRDAQSRNEKEIYFMLSNNKFLRKCWYGRYPWIRLAVDCETMVEKGINFIFCLGTAYDISSMESVGNYSVIFVDGKSMPPKMFLSLNLSFELWHLYKSLLPSAKGLSIYVMQFLFYLSLHLLL